MKFFNVVLVAALAAFANAAAVPNTEPALDTNPLEKRCKGGMFYHDRDISASPLPLVRNTSLTLHVILAHSPCYAASECCNGVCVRGGTVNKFTKYCN